jgi:tetratricopeptide (TPR) repeat protein
MKEAIDALGEPYPGLRSFRRDETHVFFGREGTISEMVDRLAAHHFLAVTGISGSGKSSLVRTGLLDALDRGMLVEAGSDWRVADFRPGGQPLSRLTTALTHALEKNHSDQELGLIEAKLASGPMGLVGWLDEINFPNDTNILLLVDQFEEIFRYRHGQGGDDIDAFVALLIASAKQRRRRIYVVITMRSDFLGDCARFTDLAETINDGQFLTPRLTREQCKEAIEGPAAVYGGKVEPALVTRMLNDIGVSSVMGGNPDQLPLMQHILMLLWERARARGGTEPELTLEDYKSLGGIGAAGVEGDGLTAVYVRRPPSLLQRIFGLARWREKTSSTTATIVEWRPSNGALSDHADRVFAELTPEQQRLAEILFRALTQGEGEGGRDTRRPVTLAEAAAIAQVPPGDLIPIIRAFGAPGRNFLTPAEPDAQAPEATIIDISHESLIRQWVRLRRWVREEYLSAETYRHIERSAKQWRVGLGNLLMKLDLAMARRWRKAEHPTAAWAERYGDSFDFTMSFLRKSERHRLIVRAIAAVAAIGVASMVSVTSLFALFLAGGLSYVNPGDERTDYGVSPQKELRREIAGHTPREIPGGRPIYTGSLEIALRRGAIEGAPFLIIDVLKGTHATTVPESKPLPYAGEYGSGGKGETAAGTGEIVRTGGAVGGKEETVKTGEKKGEPAGAVGGTGVAVKTDETTKPSGVFDDEIQHRLKKDLAELTRGDRDMPLVFFCEGVKSWQSYNAALRALDLGYTQVYWYRGGISAWDSAHQEFPFESSQTPFSWLGISTTLRTIQATLSPNPYFLITRGRILLATGLHDAAIAVLNDEIVRDRRSTKAEAYYLRGLAYTGKGDDSQSASDYNLALKDFLKAIELDPQREPEIKRIVSDRKFAPSYNARGDDYYGKKDYDRAIEEYTMAIGLDPEYALAWANRGFAFYGKDNYEKSIADLTEAIKLDGKSPGNYNGRGNAYYAKGEYDPAITDYDSAIKLNPRSAVYYSNRGNTYYRKRNYDLAIADYSEAIRFDPTAAYYNRRGNAHYAKRDYDHAFTNYDQAIRIDAKFADAYNGRGNVLYERKEWDRAIADYSRAIALNAKYALFYVNRGDAYSRKESYELALKDYDEAISLEPNASNYNGRGNVHFAKKDYDHAIQDYDAAIKLNARFTVAYSNRANTYYRTGKYERAITDYTEAIKLEPSAALYNRRGNVYYDGDAYDRAIQDYTEAIKLDREFSVAYYNRGNAFLRKGNPDRALQDYNEAVRLDPKDADFFNGRGNAYRDKGDDEPAIAAYDHAILLNPQHYNAYNNRGNVRYYRGDYNRAIADYQSAISSGLNKVTGLDNLGRAYFAKHDFDRAIAEYGKAVELQPTNAGVLSGRGRAELYSGRYAPAIEDFTAAVKARPTYPYYAIWLHMTRMRAGSVDPAELRANTARIDRGRWPWPIVGLFLGSTAPDMLEPTARSIGDISDREDQVCEAQFYLGFQRAAKDERDEARRLFESVVKSCPRRNVEYQLGRVELELLH